MQKHKKGPCLLLLTMAVSINVLPFTQPLLRRHRLFLFFDVHTTRQQFARRHATDQTRWKVGKHGACRSCSSNILNPFIFTCRDKKQSQSF